MNDPKEDLLDCLVGAEDAISRARKEIVNHGPADLLIVNAHLARAKTQIEAALSANTMLRRRG